MTKTRSLFRLGTITLLLCALIAAAGVALVRAQASSPLPTTTPEQVGMSSERLERLHAFIARDVEKGEIAGAVTVVARRGKLVDLKAQGYSDLGSHTSMRTDAMFRLASMTKPIASVAALMLLEEGRFLLEEPLSKYIPEFKNMKVGIGKPGDPGFKTVPADREVTIHDIFTHRSGLAPGIRPGTDAAAPVPPGGNPLAEFVKTIAASPLLFQPGTQWNYGSSTDVLGRLIEVVSGKSLDDFLRERLFVPLGMRDTYFQVPKDKLPRLAVMYQKRPGQSLEKSEAAGIVANPLYFSASGGLVSTPADYVRFGAMLANNGELDGKRYLSRKTIDLMTAPSWPEIPLSFLRGQSYGLTVAVKDNTTTSGLLGSPGTFGWSGAFNTYFRVDPKEQLVLLLFVQITPGNNIPLQYGFHNLVMQAIAD